MAVEGKGGLPVFPRQVSSNGKVALACRAFQLNFNISSISAVFDKGIELRCSTKDLCSAPELTGFKLGAKEADLWWKVEAEGDRAGDTTFASSVGADNHVQVGTWSEFHIVVGDKVLQLDAYN